MEPDYPINSRKKYQSKYDYFKEPFVCDGIKCIKSYTTYEENRWNQK